MKQPMFEIPDKKRVRVIIDTDCRCEADDQFAVAHVLMTSKFDVKAVIAAHYGNNIPNSMEESYKEIKKIVGLMDLSAKINVLHGGQAALLDEKTPAESEGARFIVEEAMKEDTRGLFVVNQGAITNLASAILMEPKIAEKITCIMISGGTYPTGGFEYNLCNDVNAANVVMNSGTETWQVPMNVYSTMGVPFSVLLEKVYPHGDIGKYLVENTFAVSQMFTVNFDFEQMSQSVPEMAKIIYANARTAGARAASYPGGESWILADSIVVGLMMSDIVGTFTIEGAPQFNSDGSYKLRPDNPNKIRVYNSIDSNFILDDFFAKLKYHFG